MMLLNLTNALASFQSYIHWLIRHFLDVTVISYLDDVLVFSRDFSHYEKHVREVFKALLKTSLYAKLSKYLFSVSCILFFGFILKYKSTKIKEDCISAILNWSEPKSVGEIPSFLEFADLYRIFVKEFLRIKHQLTKINQKAV